MTEAGNIISNWMLFILFAAVAGAVQYIIFYFREKGKNLATKEDIADITRKMEAVKQQFTNDTEKLKNALAILANVQTSVASVERNAIIDFNKSLFSYLNLIRTGLPIHDSSSNEELDKFLKRLEGMRQHTQQDLILFNLFIKDRTLLKESAELYTKALAAESELFKDILAVQAINSEYQRTDKADIEARIRKQREHKAQLEQIISKQTQTYTDQIYAFEISFQNHCRKYIYRLIELGEKV